MKNESLKLKITFFTVFFTINAVVIYYFPLIGFAILIVSLFDLTIYGILSASNDKQKIGFFKILSLDELERSIKLLRYATAVLSFISLITTANGLKAFVFADTQKWLAYLASFAVQAILVVFSLMMCHFYSLIKEVTTLSMRGKKLLLMVLTTFCAIVFTVSSSFSFSYIVNNAYANTKAEDSEVTIESYLMKETDILQKKNEKIGEKLRSSMQILLYENGGLESSLAAYNDKKSNELKEKLEHKVLGEYKFRAGKVKIPSKVIESWKGRYNSISSEIDGLNESFEECVKELSNCVKKYKELKKDYEKINYNSSGNGETDWKNNHQKIESLIDTINQIENDIKTLKSQCDRILIYNINKDINPYRSILIREVERFQGFIQSQNTKLNELSDEISNATDGFIESADTESILKQWERVQKAIYLLKEDDESTSLNDVDIIRQDLSNLMTNLLENDTLQKKDLGNLVDLKSVLDEYDKYNNLKKQIQKFLSENLQKTYIISDEEKTEFSGDITGNYIQVKVDQWKAIRDKDFHELFSLIKMLPDGEIIKSQTLKYNNSSDTLDSNDSQNEDINVSEISSYTAEVLKEANIIRRDLLGKITDFERAFNYFLYDFKKMAFFSAFIACFFDLGAFLTGCFMYGTRHFRKND